MKRIDRIERKAKELGGSGWGVGVCWIEREGEEWHVKMGLDNGKKNKQIPFTASNFEDALAGMKRLKEEYKADTEQAWIFVTDPGGMGCGRLENWDWE